MDLKSNGIRWVKLILFYAIFYGVLTVLVAAYAWGYSLTLEASAPTWRLDESLIGTYPDLSFRPRPLDKMAERALIQYNSTKEEDYNYWKDELMQFLEVYKYQAAGSNQNIIKCGYDNPPVEGKACDVDITQWSPCTEGNNFGYHKSSPCIFLKLNKIFGWEPDYYNQTSNLPDSMPAQLKEYVASAWPRHGNRLSTVWISCEGVNESDKEHIGPINYYPRRGFPWYFYPYENIDGYLSPLVAVHFEKPQTGVLINIECKAWAKNIIHWDEKGSVRIELMID